MSEFFPQYTVNNSTNSNIGVARTVISEETVITGNIITETAIVIEGIVKGDITTKAAIEISGKVEGDISATDVTVTSGAIKGDINSSGDIVVMGSSVIIGAIKGKTLEFNGKVKGNINIEGNAVLQGNSVLQGNLSAGNFTADEGAKIIGYVEIVRQDNTTPENHEDIEELINFEDILSTQLRNSNFPESLLNMSASKPAKEPVAQVVEPASEVTATPLAELSTAAIVEDEPAVVEEKAEQAVSKVVKPISFSNIDAVMEQEETAAKPSFSDILAEKEQAPLASNEEEGEERIVTGYLDATPHPEGETGSGESNFANEKHKMLQDLRNRMERAKRGGMSI